MELNMLLDYVSPMAMFAALAVGYIVKNFIVTNEVNRFIPLIAGVVGVVVCMANDIPAGTFSVNTVVVGLISGLASTGLYETFRNLISPKKETLLNSKGD